MRPWSVDYAGRFDELTLDSEALRGNPLGDPHERPLWVYTPPGYDDEPDRRYPSLYVLQGLTGQLDMWLTRAPMRETMPELVDALFTTPDVPPCLVVFVDAWTSIGGSQFLDSPATGRYHAYLSDEVVPFVDARDQTLPEAAHRGITGKSSGGYGAMVQPLLRPDLWGGLATHAGDALFEMCYLPDVPKVVRLLRDRYDGDYARFWTDVRGRSFDSRPGDSDLLNIWCMAACYSAEPDGTVTLPFDVDTGRMRPEVWARWLAWDPVRMVAEHADAARGLRAVYVDAGTRDEFWLDLGAEAYRRALADVGVTDVAYELFDAGHGGIGYRYPQGLRYLAERLAPSSSPTAS